MKSSYLSRYDKFSNMCKYPDLSYPGQSLNIRKLVVRLKKTIDYAHYQINGLHHKVPSGAITQGYEISELDCKLETRKRRGNKKCETSDSCRHLNQCAHAPNTTPNNLDPKTMTLTAVKRQNARTVPILQCDTAKLGVQSTISITTMAAERQRTAAEQKHIPVL